jgi:hypothetical protein
MTLSLCDTFENTLEQRCGACKSRQRNASLFRFRGSKRSQITVNSMLYSSPLLVRFGKWSFTSLRERLFRFLWLRDETQRANRVKNDWGGLSDANSGRSQFAPGLRARIFQLNASQHRNLLTHSSKSLSLLSLILGVFVRVLLSFLPFISPPRDLFHFSVTAYYLINCGIGVDCANDRTTS